MNRILVILFLVMANNAWSDTMNHYMKIANNIPKMEIKADERSQAWARSARNVLTITTESIAQTMLAANKQASAKGQPLFCLPMGNEITADSLNNLIQQTYNLNSVTQNVDGMTVSDLAWAAVTKKYPCRKMNTLRSQAVMSHVGTNN